MKKMIKPTLMLTLSSVLVRIIAFVFFIILARLLSVNEYGSFRYLLTLSMIYGIFFGGIPVALSKFTSENRNNKKLVDKYVFNSVFVMMLLFLIIILIIYFTGQDSILLIIFIFSYLIDLFYLGFSRGMLNYAKLYWFKLLENFVQLLVLLITLIIFKSLTLELSAIFYSFAGIFSLIVFEIIMPEIKLVWNLSYDIIKKIIKYSIPVTLGSIGWSILFGINTIYIKQFYGESYVAYLSVGDTLAQIFSFLPGAFAVLLMPEVSKTKDLEKSIRQTKKYVSIIAGISILGLVIMYFMKDILLNMLFTDKYILASIVIMPLSISQIAISIHNIYAAAAQGAGKPGIPSTIILFAALINVVLGYILVNQIGFVGAAISTAISCSIALLLITWKVNNLEKIVKK